MEEIKPMEIPSDYAALGVATGFNPVPPEQTRQVLLGPEGSGKSYFALGIPNALIFDFEVNGTRHMPKPRASYVKVPNIAFLTTIINKLCEDAAKGRRPFSRIAFDTIDQWVDMTARSMGEEYSTDSKDVADIRYWGKEGAGYSRLNNTLFGVIKKLEGAGYPWTAICHITEKEITVNDNRRTVARPSVHNTFYKLLAQNSEVIALIMTEKKIREVTRQYQGKTIGTGKTEEYYEFVMKAANSGALFGTTNSKVRLPDFEETILLPNPMSGIYGWDLFADKYRAVVSKINGELHPVAQTVTA